MPQLKEPALNIRTPTSPANIPTVTKFTLSHIYATLWVGFSIYISLPWLYDFSNVVSFPFALFVISGIAYLPGYFNVFMLVSLLLDRQQPIKTNYPSNSLTVLIAARNEAKTIRNTIRHIKIQDYIGKIKVIVIDNGSTDNTAETAIEAGKEFELDLLVLTEEKPGKFNALNKGLSETETELVITLDADTILNKSAFRYIVARLVSSSEEVCAVAGSILVRNSRSSLITRIQEWDYFLGIASIKRFQGLYQGTLVAQGAFSLYRTKILIEYGGWPDAIGEDIILTWNLLFKGYKVYFEPLSVAFTNVPSTFSAFASQRSRWARGMIEALKLSKPWKMPKVYIKYLTGIDLMLPYLDFCYTFFWIPGLIMAFWGFNWIVGPVTLLVMPLTFLTYGLFYMHQKQVSYILGLKFKKNSIGFLLYSLFFYQMILSPVAFWGYLQEIFHLKRQWK